MTIVIEACGRCGHPIHDGEAYGFSMSEAVHHADCEAGRIRRTAGDETFRVGDVFAAASDAACRWRVKHVYPDGRAMLRSERTEWATTRPLTWAEQIDGGRFVLVERGGA